MDTPMTPEEFEEDMREIAAAGGGAKAIRQARGEMVDRLLDEIIEREERAEDERDRRDPAA